MKTSPRSTLGFNSLPSVVCKRRHQPNGWCLLLERVKGRCHPQGHSHCVAPTAALTAALSECDSNHTLGYVPSLYARVQFPPIIRKKKTPAEWLVPSFGAGEGNRTLAASLGSSRSAIKLHPRICFDNFR